MLPSPRTRLPASTVFFLTTLSLSRQLGGSTAYLATLGLLLHRQSLPPSTLRSVPWPRGSRWKTLRHISGFAAFSPSLCDLPATRADAHQGRVPLAPGMPSLSSPPSSVGKRRSDLVDFTLQQVSVSRPCPGVSRFFVWVLLQRFWGFSFPFLWQHCRWLPCRRQLVYTHLVRC